MKNNMTIMTDTLVLVFTLTLLSACKSSPDTPAKTQENKFLSLIPAGVVSMYDPVSVEDSASEDYRKRIENIWEEHPTNTCHRTVVGQNLELAELTLNNGHIFAVYVAGSSHKNPIPDVDLGDVKKIVYGYSTEDGLVIENPDALEAILTCLKSKSLKPREEKIIIIPVEGETTIDTLTRITESRHGCTMAIRIILKNGDVVVTGGHVEDREWNPEILDVFTKIIANGEYKILGDTSVEELLQSE